MKTDDEEVFTVKACRCKRCGGILLSNYGLRNKMGHVCKAKYDLEHAPIDENQLTLEDLEKKRTEDEH